MPLRDADDSGFGALLRQLRLAARLSQEELAGRAGLSARGISDLERGLRHSPRRETVALLAEALRLSPPERENLARSARGSEPVPSLGRRRDNLPAAWSSFVGREAELAELTAALAGARLVTLIGPGGCGKTRLALEAAARLVPAYRDGVWLVDLAPLADPGSVVPAVARTVGSGVSDARSVAALGAAWHARHLLIILDNCEHLVHACAAVTAALLQACPDLRMLATSRRPLGLPGEVVMYVPPLAPPLREHTTVAAIQRSPAVRLFVERASAAAGFALTERHAPAVAEICRRLDGIPLALELAAAALRGLSVDQLAAGLDRRLRLLTNGNRAARPRQQTLVATIGWSYELLDRPEQALFHRLAVFVGGWSQAAVEGVCAGARIAPDEVAGLLVRLVDQSLVVAEAQADGTVRYRLLETVREFAQERLAASGEAGVIAGNHADYFLAVAEDAAAALQGPPSVVSWRRLEPDVANLRAAMRWSVEAGDSERGLRLGGGLYYFWYLHGAYAEGQAWLTELLAVPRVAARTAGRAAALSTAGQMARQAGDRLAARAFLREAREIQCEVGDRPGLGETLQRIGLLYRDDGCLLDARRSLEEALALAREVGEPGPIDVALFFLSHVLYELEAYEEARLVALESLAMDRALGNDYGIASNLTWLGHIAVAQGDHSTAGGRYAESLAVRQRLAYPVGIAYSLCGFANLALAQGDPVRSARLAGAAAALCLAAGLPEARTQEAGLGRRLAACSDDPSYVAAWAEGCAMSVEQAIAHALGGVPATD